MSASHAAQLAKTLAALQVARRQQQKQQPPLQDAARASPDDVVILAAARTPLCRAKRGALKSATPDVLLRTALVAAIQRSGLPPDALGDICVGNVLQAGAGAAGSRMAALVAGIPYAVPLSAVNRQCSSGLQALANIYGAIRAGVIDVGIGAGVESMSTNAMAATAVDVDWGAVAEVPVARDCAIPMGQTSETVAARYSISREDQDAFAVRSHARAAAARAAGHFADEMVPVVLADGTSVAADDGIREGTTPAALAALPPAFADGGVTTAGNASQMTDGAAAVVAARRSAAAARGAPVLGVMRAFAVVGVPPDEMGVGPAFAIPAALAQARLSIDDVDVFEINEAFASQVLHCVRALGLGGELGSDRVNPYGGAIAIGHPLGATGARQVATLLHYLRRTGKRIGVVSMCIGTGMGAAAVFENEAGRWRRGPPPPIERARL